MDRTRTITPPESNRGRHKLHRQSETGYKGGTLADLLHLLPQVFDLLKGFLLVLTQGWQKIGAGFLWNGK